MKDFQLNTADLTHSQPSTPKFKNDIKDHEGIKPGREDDSGQGC